MSDLRKAAQALVVRWDTPAWKDAPHTGQYIDALRAALAQPEPCADEDDCDYMPWCRIRKICRLAQTEQEPQPVGWFEAPHGAFRASPCFQLKFPSQLLAWSVPLYTALPQRKPLTDEEIDEIIYSMADCFSFARAIEKAHGIGGEHE